jgi:hypothetical protein
MEIENFELFSTKAEEERTEREYLDATRTILLVNAAKTILQ